ncbi:hypothetical protein [Halomonas daqiaonensis]|uniref:Uncharacterized protein n=1 Tax=Halomonas daqiaonensis TaxID=650850 RepID=A0A1H7JWP9_9GAMM|nr:hypothetical protein [Halomonas daqiaonensis]SEK79013.1 hypothetical protein SAMN04488129_104162 [Halomonas daqiaonensis]
MAGDASKGLWVTLVSGFLAIAGIGAKGLADLHLERARLDSQLIISALGSSSEESRRETLRLLVDARLIADEQTREGLKQYFEGTSPRTPPQVASFIQSGERVTLTPTTEANANKTDIDLFVCGSAKNSESAEALIDRVHQALNESGEFGRIALKVWEGNLYQEAPESILQGFSTMIVDAGHAESGQVPLMESALSHVSELPPVKVLNNPGPSTPWLISLVLCPG